MWRTLVALAFVVLTACNTAAYKYEDLEKKKKEASIKEYHEHVREQEEIERKAIENNASYLKNRAAELDKLLVTGRMDLIPWEVSLASLTKMLKAEPKPQPSIRNAVTVSWKSGLVTAEFFMPRGKLPVQSHPIKLCIQALGEIRPKLITLAGVHIGDTEAQIRIKWGPITHPAHPMEFQGMTEATTYFKGMGNWTGSLYVNGFTGMEPRDWKACLDNNDYTIGFGH